jgi:hypothetical protein
VLVIAHGRSWSDGGRVARVFLGDRELYRADGRAVTAAVFSNSGMSLKVVGKEEESGGGLGSTVDGAEEL